MAVCFVTGASRGIGEHVVTSLAEAGHVAYAGMRNPSAFREKPGLEGLRPLRLDVTDPVEVKAAVAQIIDECGRIDVLINNAGVAWFSPAEEMSSRVLQETMETNFFGAVSCTQEVLPLMRKQGSGRIIMMSSLAGLLGLPLESAYCASKSAIEAYAESLRQEVLRFGIHVSVIEPGVTVGGLSTSIPDPEAPPQSSYQALLDHTFAYYEAEQANAESPALVADTVRTILEARAPAFRHPVGAMAATVMQVLELPEAAREAALRDALEISWWCEGAANPPQAKG